jgi:hypothetical protein
MFLGELFCFRQLLEGLVNVIHGGSSVPTPIAASMFQIVPGTLECSPCGLNFGGHIPLRGSWEKVRGGRYDHQRKDYEGSNFHGSSSWDKRRIDEPESLRHSLTAWQSRFLLSLKCDNQGHWHWKFCNVSRDQDAWTRRWGWR